MAVGDARGGFLGNREQASASMVLEMNDWLLGLQYDGKNSPASWVGVLGIITKENAGQPSRESRRPAMPNRWSRPFASPADEGRRS